MSEERQDVSPPGSDDAPPESGAELDSASEEKLRDLLRGALKSEPAPESNVLRGVQKRLRERSRGKFYDDEWSTAKRPTYTYLWTSLVMLVIVLIVYAVLAPLSGNPLEVENQPAPVRIVMPKSPQQ